MRIVCISDTHGKEFSLPHGHLLIHSGDWSLYGTENETRKFIKWLEREKFKFGKIVVVPGNHDKWIEKEPIAAKQLFEEAGIDLLIDSETTHMGEKIYGSPWTPEFGKWAFMADLSKRKLVFDSIPEYTTILVTHGPSMGLLDRVGLYNKTPYANVGCPALKETVKRIKPKLHVFGHIHECAGVKRLENTLIVNASHMDEAYRPINGFSIVNL